MPERKSHVLLRLIRAWPRLLSATLAGVVIAYLAPKSWHTVTRILVGWDAGVWIFLVLIYRMIATSTTRHIAQRAATQDIGRVAILVLTVAAALATVGAIFFELGSAKRAEWQSQHVLLVLVTVLTSWVFIQTIFATHYAHEYYGERAGQKGGLNFPNDKEPDYWDFVYFAFVIGMTFQVSDVSISSKVIRRTVTAHSIVSFVFNMSLLSLTINIVANVI